MTPTPQSSSKTGSTAPSVSSLGPVNVESDGSLPRPVYEKKKRTHWLVWLVPLLVAIGTGFYIRDYLAARGPVITIQISNADGLKVGDTPLLHRGVIIGKVSGISLSEDHRHALIEVRLQRGENAFAQQGAAFWVVRPEVSGTGLQGIGTLLSGPYIDSVPGSGEVKEEFAGLPKAPTVFPEGLEIAIHSPHLAHLEESSPVYYRGEQVGVVRDVRLGRDADRVEAKLTIWRRYSALVHANSKFWAVSGFDVKGGIFSGLEMKLNSLKALVSGGIEFATPEKPSEMGGLVKPGTDFALEKEAKDDWLNWAPKIPIRPSASEPEKQSEPLIAGAEHVESNKHGDSSDNSSH